MVKKRRKVGKCTLPDNSGVLLSRHNSTTGHDAIRPNTEGDSAFFFSQAIMRRKKTTVSCKKQIQACSLSPAMNQSRSCTCRSNNKSAGPLRWRTLVFWAGHLKREHEKAESLLSERRLLFAWQNERLRSNLV